jgi:hypothetical protein
MALFILTTVSSALIVISVPLLDELVDVVGLLMDVYASCVKFSGKIITAYAVPSVTL